MRQCNSYLNETKISMSPFFSIQTSSQENITNPNKKIKFSRWNLETFFIQYPIITCERFNYAFHPPDSKNSNLNSNSTFSSEREREMKRGRGRETLKKKRKRSQKQKDVETFLNACGDGNLNETRDFLRKVDVRNFSFVKRILHSYVVVISWISTYTHSQAVITHILGISVST